MGESNRKYENAKIYLIRNSFDDDIYVGSTTQSLSQRMEKHRSDAKSLGRKSNIKLYQKMKELGLENFYIELLEKCPCNDIEELRAKEGEWIRKIATLNAQVAGRTEEQYRRDTVEHKKRIWWEIQKRQWRENKGERAKEISKQQGQNQRKKCQPLYRKERCNQSKDECKVPMWMWCSI